MTHTVSFQSLSIEDLTPLPADAYGRPLRVDISVRMTEDQAKALVEELSATFGEDIIRSAP